MGSRHGDDCVAATTHGARVRSGGVEIVLVARRVRLSGERSIWPRAARVSLAVVAV